MNENDFLQAIIVLTWLSGHLLVATERYVVGLATVLTGLPVWFIVAGDNWGFKGVAIAVAIVCIVGIIGRWPRKPKKLDVLTDEHETHLGVG